jgi:N-methylhydantoinase A
MVRPRRDYDIGIDIGGTFTDFILIDRATGTIQADKCLTTPVDPSLGFFEGIDKFIRLGIDFSKVGRIVHGTTLVTNAVIERKGASTGLIVTEGFGDLIYIGKEQRYDLYDIGITFPQPLVNRRMVKEAKERMNYDGGIITDLDIKDVSQKIDQLIGSGVESIAVCLLHSYVNSKHEKAISEIIKKRFPNIYVSISSEIMPVIKEYERWSTTIANAYVQPLVDHYVCNIEKGLVDREFRGEFLLMSSSGGTITPETARRYPIHLLESGPVGGVIASHALGQEIGVHDALAFDMGGTTAKGYIIKRSQLFKAYSMEAGRVHRFKIGSGLPIAIPNIRLIEIGAGGGSISHIDSRGVLRVGPESAGADPGPACYDLGGEDSTVTDADLLLGYLDSDFFLGGDKKLNKSASLESIDRHLHPLGLDSDKAAWIVHEYTNEEVASAFKKHAAERGIDLRGFDLIVSGGAGPIHAARIAESLKIKRVIFPFAAGVFSAIGLLLSPRSFDFSRTHRIELGKLEATAYQEVFDSVISEGVDILVKSGIARGDICIRKRLDMRYIGQGYEIEVDLPNGPPTPSEVPRIRELFEANYRSIYNIILNDNPIEIVNFKATVSEPDINFDMFNLQLRNASVDQHRSDPLKGYRDAYFPEYSGRVQAPVYDRYKLSEGFKAKGPGIIEERESTCIITPKMRFEVDKYRNVIAYL